MALVRSSSASTSSSLRLDSERIWLGHAVRGVHLDEFLDLAELEARALGDSDERQLAEHVGAVAPLTVQRPGSGSRPIDS